ncbi:Zn-ribbon domain-containing OB-fold protein [soil metagenome]
MTKPVPTQVHWDREFWNLSAQGILSAQRCRDCGHLQHYPRPACGKCLSSDRTWQHLSGRGVVYSFTVVRRPFTPGFDSEAPFVLLDVQLEEGIRMLSRLADESQAPYLAIGDSLEVVFHQTENELYLPYFGKA